MEIALPQYLLAKRNLPEFQMLALLCGNGKRLLQNIKITYGKTRLRETPTMDKQISFPKHR